MTYVGDPLTSSSLAMHCKCWEGGVSLCLVYQQVPRPCVVLIVMVRTQPTFSTWVATFQEAVE